MIENNPDAEAIAEALDRERAAGTIRGPLHGVPLLIKDNIATADGIIPIAHSQDTAGPMTRTVADGALLLTALVGSDPQGSEAPIDRAFSPPCSTQSEPAHQLGRRRSEVGLLTATRSL